MEDRVILISIHPGYVDKIIAGEKRLEFRRSWAAYPATYMVIYATSPVQKIVAIAEIKEVHSGSRKKLWDLAKEKGGGISRRELFSYFAGSKRPVAIELININPLGNALDPKSLFGERFRPPQSFSYLNEEEFAAVRNGSAGV